MLSSVGESSSTLGILGCSSNPSYSYLAQGSDNYQRTFHRRRMASQYSTFSSNRLARKRKQSVLHSILSQAYPMAHLLAHGFFSANSRSALDQRGVIYRPSRIPQRRSFCRSESLSAETRSAWSRSESVSWGTATVRSRRRCDRWVAGDDRGAYWPTLSFDSS